MKKTINVKHIDTGTWVLDDTCALDESWIFVCSHEDNIKVTYNKYDGYYEAECDLCWDLTDEQANEAIENYQDWINEGN